MTIASAPEAPQLFIEIMANPQSLTQLVETYRFVDVVTLWARERLEPPVIVARALARAVVCDGLRLQSIDGRWAKSLDKPIEFRGYSISSQVTNREDLKRQIDKMAKEARHTGQIQFWINRRDAHPEIKRYLPDFLDGLLGNEGRLYRRFTARGSYGNSSLRRRMMSSTA